MPERDQKLFLEDIIEASVKIDEYTQGMDFEGFAEDKKTFDAVIKNLMVIGEAVKNLGGGIKDANPDIEWGRIAGMRDRLIHGYFGTDKEIVWGTSKRLVPELRERTEAVLADLEKRTNSL